MSDSDSEWGPPTFLPHDVHVDSPDWQNRAIASLKDSGFCILRGSLLSEQVVAEGAQAAQKRLQDMLEQVGARGLDALTGELRFKELCKRIPSDVRYDVCLPHSNLSPPCGDGPGKFPDDETATWAALFREAHQWVWPVLQSLVDAQEEDGTNLVHKAGVVIAEPGTSTDQPWHPDGHQKGLFNVFLPLVPVTQDNGPTQFQPGSQVLVDPDLAIPLFWMYDDAEVPPVSPCVGAGEVLIFDYRVTHRGTANPSAASRSVAYLVYACAGLEDDYSFPEASLFEPECAAASC